MEARVLQTPHTHPENNKIFLISDSEGTWSRHSSIPKAKYGNPKIDKNCNHLKSKDP
jgi:hypothetical protein